MCPFADPGREPAHWAGVPLTARGREFPCGGRGLRPRAAGRGNPPSRRGTVGPTISLGRHSRHGPSGPRRECGVDAGSPCVGRPESIQSKGAPAAPRAVGNKENGPLERSKRERARGSEGQVPHRKMKCAPWTPTIAALLRKRSAAPHRGPRAICQRGQCRARRRELQEWSDQSSSHWGPHRAQRGGEWNHVPP